MAFKRGMAVPAATEAPASAPVSIGRSIRSTVIATSAAPTPAVPQRIITAPPTLREPPVRGLLVDGSGKPLRGLSQQTIEAHKAHTETASELCTNCGEQKTPAEMKTIIPNAYNSNNPLRICTACAQLAYKDPHKANERWQPSVPSVRFDRQTAAPFNARERGVTIGELVTKDTYHNEREVPAEYRSDVLVGEGNWSGGGRAGHQVTATSVAQSRERAARARR